MQAFLSSYIECALWSSTDNSNESGGDPLDENYFESDISEKTLAEMESDCRDFIEANKADLELSGLSDERQGHNFWLNRNGHGAGFWDEYSQTTCDRYNAEQAIAMGTRDFSKRDSLKNECNCPYHACERLSDASQVYGSVYLYVGNDGKIYS